MCRTKASGPQRDSQLSPLIGGRGPLVQKWLLSVTELCPITFACGQMDLLNHIAPSTKSRKKKSTARKRAPQPRAKAAKATTIDIRPLEDTEIEVELEEEHEIKQSKHGMAFGMSHTLCLSYHS